MARNLGDDVDTGVRTQVMSMLSSSAPNRALPALTPLTVVTFVLTGVNTLFALLSGYTPYVAASSVGFSCLAILPSGP